MTTKTTVTPISVSGATFQSTAIPTCDINAVTQPAECASYSVGSVYNFPFTGITNWACLDVKNCGRPVDHYALTATSPVPAIFANTAVWENQSIKSNGLSLEVAPDEVTIALLQGTFTQCLEWNKGMSIPTFAYDMKFEEYKTLPQLPYMCGASKAYLIKDAQKASQISVTDFLALSADAQKANGAYDVSTHVAPFSESNLRNPITIDKFNPNSGRYSNGFITGVTYPYGAFVNQANRVFVCNSAKCSTDPVQDKTGTIWTFKNTEPAPPSSRVNIDSEYDPRSSYYNGDFALSTGTWYQCTAKNQKKVIGDKVVIFNPCNNLKEGATLASSTTSWRAVGVDGALDFTQPVVASPFSTDVDWQLNDFYVDVDNKKVYQCTGGALKNSTTCRVKYSATSDQWKDVTTVTKNGVTISNYDAAFANNKAQARSRLGWFSGTRYLKGDLVEAQDSVQRVLFICKGTDCSSTNPLDVYNGNGAIAIPAKAQWADFSFAFEAANADFKNYDVNVNNVRSIVELSYAGFGNQIKCDSDSTAAGSATLALGKTICDTANGATAPYVVRVCNINTSDGCKNLTSAQVSALPRTRCDGHTATTALTTYYNYVPNTKFQQGDIVSVLDSSNNAVFYSVGAYNQFAAARVQPTQPGNDVWVLRGDKVNSTPVQAAQAPQSTARPCVNMNIIPLFLEIDDFFLSSGEFEVLTYGAFKLTTNSYVCDSDRVFQCSHATLCQYYSPDVFDFIWTYKPLDIPTQGTQPGVDSVMIGKLYSEFFATPVQPGDIYFKPNGASFDAYECITSPFQTYKCLKQDPSTDTNQVNWKKLDTTGKILLKQKDAAQQTNIATWANNVITPVLTSFGSTVYDFPQIRFTEYVAGKATKYVDFKFELYDTVASNDGYVFMCLDESTTPCKDIDPTDASNASWMLMSDVIASSFAEIPIIQVLDGTTWVSGTPYMKGDVICDAWGQAVLVADGAIATFKNVEDYDDQFWSVYEPLHPYYYACKVVEPKTYTVETAKDFQHLVVFDKTTGSYTTVTAGTKLFYKGRIYLCVQEETCASYKPDEIDGTWLLTDFIGKVDPAQVAITITVAVPPLADCMQDDLKDMTSASNYSYNFANNQLLNVQNGLVCSSDAETKRKIHAGDINFKNIEGGPATGLPYNMVVYKQTVNPQWINQVTLGKDFTIRAKHIETAFASFPAFCGDAPAGVDPILSCKQDLAGFFTYIKIFAQDNSFDFGSEIKYWQTGFDIVIDKPCWSLANSATQGFNMDTVSDLAQGLTLADCTYWKNPLANDVLDQFAEFKTAYYFARGSNPLPLLGAKDYANFSQVLLEKDVLLQTPSLAEDPRLTTLIAMWRYMGYGVNGTTGPSIHDIFTGHWAPNAAEAAAGLIASNKVSAALAVVYDSKFGDLGLSCADYYSNISLADVYTTYATQLGLGDEEKNQDFWCSNVQPYPRGQGPNAGLWLAYDSATSNCQLSQNPTAYHVLRSGDLKYCMADAANNGDYVKAALSIASTKKWYTDYDNKYPYVVGTLAAYINPADKVPSCRACKTAVGCATNAPTAAADANWHICDGQNSTPAAADTQYYPKELAAPPAEIQCVPWDQIQTGKIDLSVVDLVRSGTPYYICQQDRVLSCITNETACKPVNDPKADAVNFKLYEARGVNIQNSKPALFCADNTRYGGDVQPSFWSYDYSNLEFKNYGQICSYDRNVIKQISRGYQYRFNTVTGLTDAQLAITNACSSAACTQTSVAATTITRQGLWDDYYTKLQALASTDLAKKEALDTYGANTAPTGGNGAPKWQFATRSAETFLGDDTTPFQNWNTLSTRPPATEI